MSAVVILKERLDELHRKENENALMNRQMEESEEKILSLVSRMELVHEALQFLENVANSRRGVMKVRIEEVVTEAMRMIYGESYGLEISYRMKNNRSNMDIKMIRSTPDGDVRRAVGGFGGGLADCISVPIRLLVLLGSRQVDRVCILDECYKGVDSDRIHLAGEFLQLLTTKLGLQIINLSHHPELVAYSTKSFRISELDGVSLVEDISLVEGMN